MKNVGLSDKEIIKGILAGGLARSEALKSIYLDSKIRSFISRVLTKLDASDDEIKDCFQEAIIIFERNIRKRKFNNESSISTYITGIAKWTWLNMARKKRRTSLINDPAQLEQADSFDMENHMISQERRHLIKSLLETVGANCKSFLSMYMQQMSMKEIAGTKNINVQSAKNAVDRCRKKLRQLLANRQDLISKLRNS